MQNIVEGSDGAAGMGGSQAQVQPVENVERLGHQRTRAARLREINIDTVFHR